MLEELRAIEAEETVYRYAIQPKVVETLESMGLDPDEVEELVPLLGSVGLTVSPEELLDAPFRPKAPLDTKFPERTRYSDGSWRVFYGALEQDTSEKEVCHRYVKAAIGDPSKRRTAFYARFNCRFRGEAKDLRPKLDEWPLLVHDSDYSFCQNLGREAVEMKIDGFFAPSARHAGGTTVPVFVRAALSDPEILGHAVFSIHPGTGEIKAAFRQEVSHYR